MISIGAVILSVLISLGVTEAVRDKEEVCEVSQTVQEITVTQNRYCKNLPEYIKEGLKPL